jgi:hypothetical protein
MILAWIFSNWRLVLIGTLMLGIGIQEARIRWVKSDFETYQLNIEKAVAQNRLQNAQEATRIERNGKEALDALQSRYAALNRSYKRLRDRSRTDRVPDLPATLGIAQSCPGEPGKPNPVAGQVGKLEEGIEGIIEFGDGEIAKYVELYRLQQKNAGK